MILAAGESIRMGGQPKALLEWEGETFLARLQRVFRECCDEVIVVLGYHAAALRPYVTCREIVNPTPELGMLSSLQTGLRSCASFDRILFSPVDLATFSLETVRRVVSLPECPIAMPRYRGARGHPVRVSRSVADELIHFTGTAPRDVIRRFNAQAIYAEVEDPGILVDVDTREDYERLVRR